MRRAVAGSVVALAAVGLVACTAPGPDGPSTPEPTPTPSGPPAAEVRLPEEESVVVADDDPTTQNIALAGEVFVSAPIVVTAPVDDAAAQLGAASAAVALGMPLLLAPSAPAGGPTAEPTTGDAAPGLVSEVERLGAETVLAFGDVPDTGLGADVVAAPAEPGALADLLGLAAEEVAVAPGQEVAAVATLELGRLRVLGTGAGDNGATDSATGDDEPELPPTAPAEPVDGLLVVTTGGSEQLAAVTTARAAGADVVVVPDGDPRASSATVQAVAQSAPTHVLGLGTAVGDATTLGWRTATAATGVELPGGGQRVLPGKTYVALYGHPATSALGVLGEQGPEATVERARAHAAPYTELTNRTVVPALEIIATIASGGPGDDGDYSQETSIEDLRELVDLAGQEGMYVLLDLQPGRTDFLTQAQRYEELLRLPHVGLALDPEWRLGQDQVHLRQIGQVDVTEVDTVVTWLADLVRDNDLPQKLLVLHQFQVRMIPGVDGVDQSRSELEILVHVDGQGGQGAKQGTWATLHANAPNIRWWGWKNFYDEDIPMLTPAQTAQVEPFPDFISYQ